MKFVADRMLGRRTIRKGIVSYLVRSQDVMEQLKELQEEFNISFEPAMDRCTLCNSVIRKVEKDEIGLVREKEYVYPAILEGGTEFWICDKCQQVYWPGKHWENIRERVDRLKRGMLM